MVSINLHKSGLKNSNLCLTLVIKCLYWGVLHLLKGGIFNGPLVEYKVIRNWTSLFGPCWESRRNELTSSQFAKLTRSLFSQYGPPISSITDMSWNHHREFFHIMVSYQFYTERTVTDKTVGHQHCSSRWWITPVFQSGTVCCWTWVSWCPSRTCVLSERWRIIYLAK